ncbi:FGGY-family carbohydrate kinase [Martelella soudanensis]|uniref:FGGY-family carbohydrate kinase n=1 Tax=unclassified Martelella TaxID=2629616 RepID=UPI0015DED17B|nr:MULTISPECIES: FGGY-family carbohydrate kinase [unclassified Martelella]
MTYLLGLDAGNTVIKAVLFDANGRQCAMHALDGRSETPRPGYVERNLDELWSNAGEAIRICIGKAGIDPSKIAGIGCAGHGNGLYMTDRDGAPLLGIQSLDNRAAGHARIMAERDGDRFYALCRQMPWPSQTPSLMGWIKANVPDIYARAGTAMLCKDFITFRLTGERVSDISDMSGCGLLRLPEGDYDDELLGLYGLEDARRMLPRLCDPSEVVGGVCDEAARATGLVPGTPVIAGYFDVIASAMGSGVVRAGEASIIAGTWSINQVFSHEPVNDPDVFMVSAFGPGRFVNIESSATSAANLEWYVREFVERGAAHGAPFEHCNEAVGAVRPAADDPIFHPFLYGSRTAMHARAGLYGVAGWHTEGHVLRSLFEGVMFEHRRHVNVLANAGLAIESAVLSGGGSRSDHWPQIFADGLGIPVTTAEARETGALGAAIGAGVATGLFGSYETAIAAMTRPRGRFEPDPAMRGHYDRRYAIYQRLNEAMGEIWSAFGKSA